MNITISEAAIKEQLLQTTGGIARELERVARTIVVPDAQESLSRQAVPHFNGRWVVWPRNPPPGPPMRRTGRLIGSIQVGTPEHDLDGGLVVGIKTEAINPRGERNYSRILMDRDYHFLPPKYYDEAEQRRRL